MQATANILDEIDHSPFRPRSRAQPLTGGVVWNAASLKPTDGIVELDDDALQRTAERW